MRLGPRLLICSALHWPGPPEPLKHGIACFSGQPRMATAGLSNARFTFLLGLICGLTSSCQVPAQLRHQRRLRGHLLCTACNAFCFVLRGIMLLHIMHCLQLCCFSFVSFLSHRPALLSSALPRYGN